MPSYRNNPLGFGFNIGMTPGVKFLLIANTAAFVGGLFVPLGNWFALIPAMVARGAIWQLFTYQFLHAGIGNSKNNRMGAFGYMIPKASSSPKMAPDAPTVGTRGLPKLGRR